MSLPAIGDTPSGRWTVTFRERICYLLACARIHNPACEHCAARATCGGDLIKRLEELKWQTIETDKAKADAKL